MYGKANPADAIEVIDPYVQGIHAKDGLWPTNPRDLGQEVPIGKGKVDFPRMIAGLKKLDYRGAVTIEREISGPEQMEDVRAAKAYLERLIETWKGERTGKEATWQVKTDRIQNCRTGSIGGNSFGRSVAGPGGGECSDILHEAWTRSQEQIRKLIPVAEESKIVIAIAEVWNKFLLSTSK